ncbi:MAG: methylenetetrahydrofolate reductase [NAD(P)H] [Alphaproteobacteria bacterium]|nr:methylenetetrahydrofolate reductase [NAD(P)H] [Alphaproteobacteria bacterium]
MKHNNYNIASVFSGTAPRVSFEFFPPKTDEMEAKLWQAITTLAPLNPAFASVTYGAGGSTRERTHQTVVRMVSETSLQPAAHLTCVDASCEEVNIIAQKYWQAGIRHIVALRGDPQDASAAYAPHPQGYAYASDLVAGLKHIADFEISVAAFPEGHPENGSIEADLENLARKVEAGASRAITQYFFDVDLYLNYVQKARKAGITIPILPGLLPVTNFKQLKKFSAMCGATVPAWLENLFEGLDSNPSHRNHVAVIVAAEQCRILREAGVEDFHFYTLNRADLTLALCHILGVRPAP